MYDVDFEICALLILLSGAFEFFRRKQFPSTQNVLFSALLFVACVGMMVNITVPHAIFRAPDWGFHILMVLFYSFQTMFPFLFMLYTLNLIRRIRVANNAKRVVLLVTPFALTYLVLLTTPWTGAMYHRGSYLGYQHGPVYLLMVFEVVFCLVAALAMILANRKKVEKDQLLTILLSLFFIILGIGLQAAIKDHYIIGVSVTLALVFMFFNTQKPYAMLDINTGLLNLSAMKIFIDNYISEHRSFQLMVIDLSWLEYNKMLSEVMVAQYTRKVAEFLNRSMPKGYVFCVSKYRFAVITNHPDMFYNYVDLVQTRFETPWAVEGNDLMIDANLYQIPDTSFLTDVQDVVRLFEHAAGQFQSSTGKSIVLDATMFDNLQRETYVADCIRTALREKKWLEFYFQPIYSLPQDSFLSAEALLRLIPAEEVITPAEFIPVAERIGLMINIDCYVIQKIAAFINKQDPGQALLVDHININLSGQGFSNDEMFAELMRAFEKESIDPRYLHFELTEERTCADVDQLKEYMEAFTQKGIRFALDDFGTGFSNIARVTYLPFSTIKIDRSILNASEKVLTDTLNLIAHSNCKIVVEGVETAAQIDLLRSLHIDEAQGYFYARPMPEEDFVEFMERQKSYARKT